MRRQPDREQLPGVAERLQPRHHQAVGIIWSFRPQQTLEDISYITQIKDVVKFDGCGEECVCHCTLDLNCGIDVGRHALLDLWIERLWKDSHSKINFNPHKKPARFLGCYLEEFECKIQDLEETLGNRPEQWPRDSEDKIQKSPFAPKDPHKVSRGYVYNLQQ